MDSEAKRVLETAIGDLRGIAMRLSLILPEATGSLTEELLALSDRLEDALRSHTRPASSSLAERVGQAAFGMDGIGLRPPSRNL